MTSSRRQAMVECPHCSAMTSEVLECSRCGAEGCKDADCIMRLGKSRPCTDCRDTLIERTSLSDTEDGEDDSGVEQALSDEDIEDD